MQPNLNEYNQEKFQSEFIFTPLYQRLNADYDLISFTKYFDYSYYITIRTPREIFGDKTNNQTVFSAVPFYYLKFLLDKNPTKIYDVGCGWNIFKKYIPNLVGISAEDPSSKSYHADQHDYVDEQFVQGHQDYFESVFSICALHFRPLHELSQVVTEFYSMIKPQGRGFLALNITRMIERETDSRFANFEPNDYESFVRQQLSDLKIKYLVVDVELDHKNLNELMDGNIRLVMEK